MGPLVDLNLTSSSAPTGSVPGTSTSTAGSSEMSHSFILPPSSLAVSVGSGATNGPANSTSTPKSRPHPDSSSHSTTLYESELSTGSLPTDANQSGSCANDLSGSNLSSTNTGLTPTVRTGGRTLREAMKRHYKRAKAAMADNSSTEPQENHDFIIVTADNTQWHFEAPSTAVRDEWIQQIDAVIHQRLRSGVSLIRNSTGAHISSSADTSTSGVNASDRLTPQTGRSGGRPLSTGGGLAVDGLFKLGGGEDVCGQEEVLQRLSALAGNDCCADCGAANPEWASLNLVVLICIECSGVHRELGTHISRVRSATLDTWTREHLAVMASFGNTLANSVWEASA
ncbi:unnamed protein product, partial [Echinostoma caproni]|uniref:Arf-GAP domain-containing protein n=1 Tax=Echinostoma caproni TaxID=27848 RepID=A0A183AKE1_9TREM